MNAPTAATEYLQLGDGVEARRYIAVGFALSQSQILTPTGRVVDVIALAKEFEKYMRDGG